MRALLLSIAIVICYPIAYAAQDYYSFATPQQQQRFYSLTSELRCLVCQNQNLAESNAPLANDLRNQVYQQIQQGQSDQQIVDYLVTRYGDYILYKPPFNKATLGLWIAPFLLLLTGISYLFYYLSRKNHAHS